MSKCPTMKTECISAVVPFTNNSNTTSGTTRHGRQYTSPNIMSYIDVLIVH